MSRNVPSGPDDPEKNLPCGRFSAHQKGAQNGKSGAGGEVFESVRDVKVEGDRLIYTSRPAPFGGDGKMSVATAVWEKVR